MSIYQHDEINISSKLTFMCSFKERGEIVFPNNVAWLPIQNGLFGVEFLYTLAHTAAVANLFAFLVVMVLFL